MKSIYDNFWLNICRMNDIQILNNNFPGVQFKNSFQIHFDSLRVFHNQFDCSNYSPTTNSNEWGRFHISTNDYFIVNGDCRSMLKQNHDWTWIEGKFRSFFETLFSKSNLEFFKHWPIWIVEESIGLIY